MKNLLEKELRLLAQEILDIKTDEDLSLCHEKTRLLYEKLTVMMYTGHHLGSQNTTDVKEETPVIIPTEEINPSSNTETSIVDVEETDEKIEEIPTTEAAKVEKVEETISEPIQSVSIEGIVAIDEDGSVIEDIKVEINEEITLEEEPRNSEKKKSRRISKTSDIFQQSLFDQDLFSNEIIGFDPDDDIFEKAPSVNTEKDSSEIIEPVVPIADAPQEDKETENSIEEVEEKKTTETPVEEAIAIEEKEDNTARLIDEIIDSPINIEPASSIEKKSFFSFRIMETDDYDIETPTDNPAPSTITEETSAEERVEEEIVGNTVEEAPEAPEVIIEEEKTEDTAIENAPLTEGAADESIEEIITEEKTEEKVIEDIAEETSPSQEAPITINEALAQNTSSSRKLSVNEMLASRNIAITLNDRLAFINNLFDGEVEDFENTIRYIFSQKEVDVVIEYITEIIKPYYNNWIEKEEYEKRFMEIILKYFS